MRTLTLLLLATVACFLLGEYAIGGEGKYDLWRAPAGTRLYEHPLGGSFVWESYDNVAAADTNAVYSLFGLSASQETTLTMPDSANANIDFPRSIDLTISGTSANVNAGTATVTGINIAGNVMTETYTLVENTTGTLTGSYAFSKITTVVFPQQDGANVKCSIGLGKKLGLPMAGNPQVILGAWVSGSPVSSDSFTVVADYDEVEKNTIDFDTPAVLQDYNGVLDYVILNAIGPIQQIPSASIW